MNQAIISLVVLNKVLVLKFVLTRTEQPRYRVQDGSWPNHKNVWAQQNETNALTKPPHSSGSSTSDVLLLRRGPTHTNSPSVG